MDNITDAEIVKKYLSPKTGFKSPYKLYKLLQGKFKVTLKQVVNAVKILKSINNHVGFLNSRIFDSGMYLCPAQWGFIQFPFCRK